MTHTIVRGDWFALAPDYHLALFTANAIVTADGRLVMGAGLARQIRDRCPGIDRLLGAAVRSGERPDGYGRAVGGRYERPLRTAAGEIVGIGAFQVKRDWRERASIDLIARSIHALNRYLAEHDGRVLLNYPGIGCGGLDPAAVAPLLQGLDDRVTVCYL